MTIDEIREKIVVILKKHGVKRAGLFGSYVRGEEKIDSDIDILVEVKKDLSLLDFVGIKLEIEDKLHHKVDLVEYSTIKPLIKKRIMDEERRIL